MEKEVSYFIDLAYKLFPKGVWDEDPAYTSTPEHQKLRSLLEQSSTNDIDWDRLLESLKPDLHSEDVGIPDPINRNFRTVFILNDPKRHGIVLTISRLIPYYCFYTESGLEGVKFNEPGFFRFSGFSKADQEVIDRITDKLSDYFPGYEPFPLHLHGVKLEDLILDGKGKLASQSYRQYWRELTLYDVFFFTHMFM